MIRQKLTIGLIALVIAQGGLAQMGLALGHWVWPAADWKLDGNSLVAQQENPFQNDARKKAAELRAKIRQDAEDRDQETQKRIDEIKKRIEDNKNKQDDPFANDPFFQDNEPRELTPEEAAAAQSAAGCFVCGVCGIYGAAVIIPIICAIAGVALQIFLTVYTYNDAVKNRVENPALWAVLVFFTGLIGFLVYFLAARNNNNQRPQYPQNHPPHPPQKPY